MSKQTNSSSSEGISPTSSKVVSESWPLPGSGVDDLVGVIYEIVGQQGAVVALHVYAGREIQVERRVRPEEHLAPFFESAPTTLDHVRNSADILEYPTEDIPPAQALFEMSLMLSQEKLELNRFVVRNKEEIKDWLSLPSGISADVLLGAPVEEDSDLPTGVLLVCGTPSRLSPARDIQMAIKGVM